LLVIIVGAIQSHQLPSLLVVDRGVNQLICLGNVSMGYCSVQMTRAPDLDRDAYPAGELGHILLQLAK
jgi:hypothetical protein